MIVLCKLIKLRADREWHSTGVLGADMIGCRMLEAHSDQPLVLNDANTLAFNVRHRSRWAFKVRPSIIAKSIFTSGDNRSFINENLLLMLLAGASFLL